MTWKEAIKEYKYLAKLWPWEGYSLANKKRVPVSHTANRDIHGIIFFLPRAKNILAVALGGPSRLLVEIVIVSPSWWVLCHFFMWPSATWCGGDPWKLKVFQLNPDTHSFGRFIGNEWYKWSAVQPAQLSKIGKSQLYGTFQILYFCVEGTTKIILISFSYLREWTLTKIK